MTDDEIKEAYRRGARDAMAEWGRRVEGHGVDWVHFIWPKFIEEIERGDWPPKGGSE